MTAECIPALSPAVRSLLFSRNATRALARPSFLDNERYAGCIPSRCNNAISCKSCAAPAGESDRLLNYRRLAARCLIIALTPSRNIGRGVPLLFFYLFTSIYETHLGVVAAHGRRLEGDFARHINACKSRRVNVDDTNGIACQGRHSREFLSFSPRELSCQRTCVYSRGNVSEDVRYYSRINTLILSLIY